MWTWIKRYIWEEQIMPEHLLCSFIPYLSLYIAEVTSTLETVISSNKFHIWILFSLGVLGKQEHALKWAFMPQSAWGQGTAPKSLRPSHGCWFHPQTERASQQDTASLLFSSHSLIASLWQVKCQEPGRGGVWRRRGKRFSPSINLKTYSADNLNGTGISFSMVTRDGRRLEKKKRERVQTRENLMLKTQEKLQTLQLLFAVQVACRREKSPFLACTVWDKLSHGHDEVSFLRAMYWCGGGGNPLFCTSPTQRKDKCLLNTGNLGKLQIIAPQKTALSEREKIWSFPVQYFLSTDQSHWCRFSLWASSDHKPEWRINIALFVCFASYTEENVCYFCYAEPLRCTDKNKAFIYSFPRHTKMKHGSRQT